MFTKINVQTLIDTIRLSTGTDSTFSVKSVANRMIQLAKVEKELKAAMDVLKASIEEYIEELPYENEDGIVSVVPKETSYQDVPAIKKAIPTHSFDGAISIIQSRLDDHSGKFTKKQLIAIVKSHTHVTGETHHVRVTVKELRLAKGVLSVKPEEEETATEATA